MLAREASRAELAQEALSAVPRRAADGRRWRRGRKRAPGYADTDDATHHQDQPTGLGGHWIFVSDTLSAGRGASAFCASSTTSAVSAWQRWSTPARGGVRVVRELERLTIERATPETVVSDNGTELTSGARCCAGQPEGSRGTTSSRASRCRTRSSNRSTASCATSVSTSTCQQPRGGA